MTCRKRKTRCFGERPVCSTCTKNSYTCQGYSDDAEKKNQEEGSDVEGKKALARTQPLENDLDDENERRHSKSKLSAARSTLSPMGGPPPERGTDERLRKPGPFALDGRDPLGEAQRLQDGGFADGPAFTQERRDSTIGSQRDRRSGVRRVPYFRHFGPTAIVPGYQQMMVSVEDRRRINPAESLSDVSPAPALRSSAVDFDGSTDEALSTDKLPVYDPNSSEPVPPLILSLVQTFFLHLGSSYPFLKQDKFHNQVKEKKVGAILVDAVCALAARFSESAVFSRDDSAVSRWEHGHFYAQRAKAATVDTFSCPSVGAVQACLLMAYEGFGANQDSALWMYLGLAIRMAVDLGLQKVAGVKFHGEKDPLHTSQWSRPATEGVGPSNDAFLGEATVNPANLSPSEQREIKQERIDTLWAVFALDRVVSSATGRPVTFRYDDFELGLPEPTVDSTTGWPDPYPHFIRIIHLYGQVSDVLNNIRNTEDPTDEEWNKLATMEAKLTKEYQSLDQRLDFNAGNFRAYATAGEAKTFMLLHFWIHALIIVLHRPTLLAPLGGLGRSHQLLPNSRELSMSSAKTIADILTFAELIDPKSLVGNPFGSQPIYLAACAFLMEAAASGPKPVSPTPSPRPGLSRSQGKSTPGDSRSSNKHFLFSSAASQGYQRCYDALVQLHGYWGGIEYILTALDQKSEGIWDAGTCTRAEYEGTRPPRRESASRVPEFEVPGSDAPPVAWSATGTSASPGSDFTLMYQGMNERQRHAQGMNVHSSTAIDLGHSPPHNVMLDPARQRPYPQATTSAIRHSQMPMSEHHYHHQRSASKTYTPTKVMRNLEHLPPGDAITPPPSIDRTQKVHVGMVHPYTPSSHGTAYEPAASGALDGRHHAFEGRERTHYAGLYREVYGEEVVGFDGQVDVGSLGMQEVMPGWMAYLPAMNMYDGMGG